MNPDIETKVQGLLKAVDRAFLQLGQLLADAQSEGGDEYSALLTLVGRRRAYHLIKIHRMYSEVGLDKTELAAIGWTKLSVIAPKVTSQNVGDYLQLAKSLPVRQLRLAVSGRPPSDAARVIVVHLTELDYFYFRHLMVEYGAKVKGKSLVGQDDAFAELLGHYSEAMGE